MYVMAFIFIKGKISSFLVLKDLDPVLKLLSIFKSLVLVAYKPVTYIKKNLYLKSLYKYLTFLLKKLEKNNEPFKKN